MAQCPACGTQASSKFCPSCGAQVPQPAASAMPTPPPVPQRQGQTPVPPPYPPQQAPYPPQQGYAPQQGMYPGMAPQPAQKSGGWLKWVLGGVGVLFVLLVALILFGGTPAGVGEVYINTDKVAEHMAVIPSNSEFIYAVAEVKADEASTVTAKWYMGGEHVPQLDTNFDVQADFEDFVSFHITGVEKWPAGNYKVEIYFNGTKEAEKSFQVKLQ